MSLSKLMLVTAVLNIWISNKFLLCSLTHWGRVMHICISILSIIGSDNGLAPSHYLNQCLNIVNWTLRNKLQWNINQNSYSFIQENAFENVVWKIAAILASMSWVCAGRRCVVWNAWIPNWELHTGGGREQLWYTCNRLGNLYAWVKICYAK